MNLPGLNLQTLISEYTREELNQATRISPFFVFEIVQSDEGYLVEWMTESAVLLGFEAKGQPRPFKSFLRAIEYERFCADLDTKPNGFCKQIHFLGKEGYIAHEIYWSRIKDTPSYRCLAFDFSARCYKHHLIMSLQDVTLERSLKERPKNESREDLPNSALISELAHAFRNPLAQILSSKELLERYDQRLTRVQKQKYWHQIDAAVGYLQEMLERLSLISRAADGSLKPEPKKNPGQRYCRASHRKVVCARLWKKACYKQKTI